MWKLLTISEGVNRSPWLRAVCRVAMAHYLSVTWDGAGNFVPTLGIASALVESGHDIRMIGAKSLLLDRQRPGEVLPSCRQVTLFRR